MASEAKKKGTGRGRDRAKSIVTYVLLSIWALIVLFPFYWMVLTSFKSYGSYNSEYVPRFVVTDPTVQNYKSAFTEVPLARYFTNTFLFTIITTAPKITPAICLV